VTKVKTYDNQHLNDLEKSINEFLKKVKRLIDVKFTPVSKSDGDKYAALIVYEENTPVKEDPQIYE
jgi:hypothetical protein